VTVKKRTTTPLEGRRVARLLDVIARMAGGDLEARAPISPHHDTVDALAFGLNLLGGELAYTLDGLHKAREEADRARAAREIFFRNVTHELRTPITAILLVAEVIRGPELGDQQRRRLGDRIERSARSLMRLVDQVLDLSRLEAQRLELLREAVSLETLVREVIEALEIEAEAKSVRLWASVGRDVPAIVLTDATQLRQILVNVIGNAVKFTEAGHIEVRLGHDAKRDLVTVDVIDTGVGITDEDRAQLFEPFARGRATAHRFPGTGLGLVLSRRLARALGGDLLLVKTAPGKGSRFRLTLPGPPRQTSAG
jgi:signal transduction histidine kinase